MEDNVGKIIDFAAYRKVSAMKRRFAKRKLFSLAAIREARQAASQDVFDGQAVVEQMRKTSDQRMRALVEAVKDMNIQ